jgi:NAD(P)-dependent dehydrogenase (short-subunit alcohol dehydrogenase family)
MPIDSLQGRHILILGGSDGMGYATARYLLKAGAVVTICGRSEKKLEAAHARLLSETGVGKDNLRSTALDACDTASVAAATKLALDDQGELDGVFVTAGGSGMAMVVDHTTAFLAAEWANNLFPVMNAIVAAVPHMKRKGGSIVALSSVAAIRTLQGLAGYNAAKAGLEQYVATAADELGQYKIRVNSVRPGLTKTGVIGDEIEHPVYRARFTKHTPLGFYGVPDDFGPMVSMLLSPESSWITGQTFSIDGGLSLRGYGGDGLTTD